MRVVELCISGAFSEVRKGWCASLRMTSCCPFCRTKGAMLCLKVGEDMVHKNPSFMLLCKRFKGVKANIRQSERNCRVCACKCYGESCK